MRTQDLPPLEVLKHYYRVDQHSRLERWTAKHGWRLAAKIRTGSAGYFTVGFQGKQFMAHRIIWALHHGRQPNGLIDHINGQRWDNRIENLREATPAQNAWNSKNRWKGNSTGHDRVFRTHSGRYRGRVIADYQPHLTPEFDDPELAELAASEIARRVHGEFAYENREAA